MWLRALLLMSAAFLACHPSPLRGDSYDVVIYGGTSAGVAAAVQAARMGKSVALIEPTTRLGGMTTNGLGCTDSGNKGAIQGFAREYYARVHNFTGDWSDYGGTFNLTPAAGLSTFQAMIAEAGVQVFYQERLDRSPTGVTRQGTAIQTIRMESGRAFSGSVFIDAGYEGDLMAASGVSYTVGRESNARYGESYNGAQAGGPRWTNHNFNDTSDGFSAAISPYVVAGVPSSGLLPGIDSTGPGAIGTGDNRIQSYNYRLTLTKAANRRPWTAPAGYDSSKYEILRRTIAQNGITDLNKLLKIDSVGDNKYDLNNNGPVSTDFIGQNYAYPEADYTTRQQIEAAHKQWQQGLLYFLATDASVPLSIRTAMNSYGLTADEFTNTEGWSEQIYVREARRMVGRYVMTDRNVRGLAQVNDSIGLAAYTMDSHHTERFVANPGTTSAYVLNEGNVQYGVSQPYSISYGSITPKAGEASNLLVTSALSSSHIAYGSIRMEPVFMILGQAGGAAAALAIDQGASVQGLNYATLRQRLIADGALLDWPANIVPMVGTAGADFNDLTGLPVSMQYTTCGTGFTGTWGETLGTTTLDVEPGNLAYMGGGYAIVQTGAGVAGKVQGDYSEPRQNCRNLAGAMQGEIWMSLLVNNPNATARAGLSLNPTTNGDPDQGAIFNCLSVEGDQLTVTWGGATTSGLATLATGQTHLLLARLVADYSGNDTLEVWVDPARLMALGAPTFRSDNLEVLSYLSSVGTLSFNSAGPNHSANGGYLDALRISNSSDAFYQVTGVQMVPGDASRDGRVDAEDANILATNWGRHVMGSSMGDFNGDGMVNAADASILAANWGYQIEGESMAVPEPGVLIMLMASGLMWLTHARRKQRSEDTIHNYWPSRCIRIPHRDRFESGNYRIWTCLHRRSWISPLVRSRMTT